MIVNSCEPLVQCLQSLASLTKTQPARHAAEAHICCLDAAPRGATVTPSQCCRLRELWQRRTGSGLLLPLRRAAILWQHDIQHTGRAALSAGPGCPGVRRSRAGPPSVD